MMTVKHVALSGEEYIYPTSHVNYVPTTVLNDLQGVDTLWWYDTDGRAYPITGGKVYVMNDSGKTVSRYELSKSAPDGLGLQNPPLS